MSAATRSTHDAPPPASREAVIETDGLTRYFGHRKVVDDLTMAVPRGSVFAFLGRNGSGKTTTIRMLLGLLSPTRGSSTVLGHDSRRLPPEVRGRVGYMAESHVLYDWMSVRECGAYQAHFYRRWNERIFTTIIGHFQLDLRATAAQLSRGERAGLSLAITLATEPELLILDDPALGLDPVARQSLLEAMLSVTRGADRTILLSSHLLDDVERVADSIAILDRSVLRACCSIDTFRASVTQFALRYTPATAPPAQLPPIRGLLRTRRPVGGLRLTVAAPDDTTQRLVRSLGADSVEERPVTFAEAVVGYLDDHGEQASFLEDPAPTATRGAT